MKLKEKQMCEFHKTCKKYSRQAKQCNETAGYFGMMLSSCWKEMNNKIRGKK